MEQAMHSQRWNIMENTSLSSTSLYDYFHGLSVQLMRMIRQRLHNIATYDIQGLGLQQVETTEKYGLYPPVTVNCSSDFSLDENGESNLRLRIIDWNHLDRGYETLEAMWSGDVGCDQILELLQGHRINLTWHHVLTYNSDYQDDIEEESEAGQETHDNQEIEGAPNNPEENNYGPFIAINLTLQTGEVLEIIVFDLGENVEVENPDRGSPPIAKSAEEDFTILLLPKSTQKYS